MKHFLILILIPLIAACSPKYTWKKPDCSVAEFKKDVYECQRDALGLNQPSALYRPSSYDFTPGGQMQRAGDDLMDISRDLQHRALQIKIYENCMESKGYVKVPID